MSSKENKEFSDLTVKLGKELKEEADLLCQIYEWFNNIGMDNKNAARNIFPQDLNIEKLTTDRAEEIESRTGVPNLSELIRKHENVIKEIGKHKSRLTELWDKIIKGRSLGTVLK